ncbi:MAG: LysM peptidoglycan-binding domain-containing protein [Proteobacteria bacterium]|nr:LysM peptidoglycan-binding domain-containing protein [Pseudomonadota bacterium]
MSGRRGSRDFFRKKRNKSWRGITALLVFGIAFVVAAVALFSNKSAGIEEAAPRRIAAHASSGMDLPVDAPNDKLPSVEKPKENPAPPPAVKRASLSELPPQHGAIAPKLGRFYVVERDLAFDANVSSEVIAAAKAKPYVVVAGDILGRIAKQHGCTIEQIQKANRLTGDQIKIGQKLLIPDCQSGEIQPLVEAAPAPSAQRGRWWKAAGVDTTTLPRLMREESFKPPQRFMAFVIEFTFDATRQVVIRERAFDYQGTSSKSEGWNPASSVKLFAAITALRRIDELGFTSRAKVTFHGKRPYTTTVGALIEAAIIQSDNIAYNRVVQLASFDKLHRETLTSRYGISRTALNRGYELTRWRELGEDPSLRVSPEITLSEGKKTTKLPAAKSNAPAACSASACTTLQDLGESIRRLMLQEQLPASETFNLKQQDLLVLRRAMRSEDRQRGTEIVDIFAKIFKDSRVKFYAKPGFSEDWFTDNIYIFDPRHNQAWIVVMSGYPGRRSLDDAARVIAKIISSGKLRNVR